MAQIHNIIANHQSFTSDQKTAFAKALEVANATRKRQIVFEDDFGFGFVSLDFWRFPGEGMDGIFEDCFRVGEVCPE